MELAKGHRANFKTLLRAAENQDLALLDCQDKATGKSVAVIVAISQEKSEHGDVVFIPLAKMFDGNPFDELNPPDPQGGYRTEPEQAHA